MNQRVVIVGAGVCGLTLAYQVARAGLPVTLIEKQGVVGGLARGFTYGDFHFDVGPHRFYSPIQRVMDLIGEVLGENSAEITRTSSVHFLGRYHDWPLKLGTVFKLPPLVSARAFFDLLLKGHHHDPSDPSFENYILGKYGRTLYTLFFRDYTEKFLGIPASQTHSNWAKIGVERATIDEKVNTATLQHIVKMMLLPRQREMTFVYPPGGVQVYSENLRRRLLDLGGEIRQSATPTALLSADGEIRKVVTPEGAIDCRQLVWTAPINELTALLGLPDPSLEYLALVLYNTTTRRPNRQPVQWCYYGARDLSFSRISYPGRFHPSMVPPGKGSMCVELPCREGDEHWRDPERMEAAIRADLVRVDAIADERDIEAIHVERIDHAYPVYDLTYRDKLNATRRRLGAWRNLFLGGRTGLFWYNNMDHSINNALQISKKILGATLNDSSDTAARSRAGEVLDDLEHDDEGALAHQGT